MNRDRIKGAPWFEKVTQLKATVIGSGGIGSWLSLFLCRMGMNRVYLVDFDYTEEHNLGGQLLGVSSVGKKKVAGMYEVISEFAPEEYNLEMIGEHYDPEHPYNHNDAIFIAVDNMEARRQIVGAFIHSDAKILLDARLEPEQLTVYVVRKHKAREHFENLPNDEDIPDLDCTFKQTSHTAAMVAGFAASLFTNAIAGYELPYKVELYIPAMFIEISD